MATDLQCEQREALYIALTTLLFETEQYFLK